VKPLYKYASVLLVLLILIGYDLDSNAQTVVVPKDETGIKIEEAWTYFHDNDFQGAVDLLKNLLKEHPENSLVEHTLGVFYLRERKWDEAAKYFQDSLVHATDDQLNLWNHIYLAEIFKSKGFLEKANGHLDFVEAHELSSSMMLGVAKIRMDIRIMENLDAEMFAGNIIIRYPNYLLPEDKIESMGQQIASDWKRVTSFLNLSSDQNFEVFIYPTERMMDKFFPPNTAIRETNYAYDQIHTLFCGDSDYLSALAPYGFYLLARKFNRQGSIPWMIGGLDDAIRGEYMGVPLNTWILELHRQEKLPSLLFLIDPQYLNDMVSGIKDPTAGSFINYLKDKIHPNDFYYILTQPNLELNLEKSLGEIETDWIRYAKGERSLLQSTGAVQELVSEVEKFIEPPVITMYMVDELKKAAEYYEMGKPDDTLRVLDLLLLKEPRYGDALYLKAKVFYDRSEILAAKDIFQEAVKYLPRGTIQAGWSYYFLGRIARLQKKYDEAREYYLNAILSPLPAETLEYCNIMVFRLEKYLYLAPNPLAEVSSGDIQGLNEFLGFLDDTINSANWQTLGEQLAYDLNEKTLKEFLNWYRDPVRYRDNVKYHHELVKAEISQDTTRLQVIVRVEYPKDTGDITADERTPQTMSMRSVEYTRFILLTYISDEWRILDYFDEIELYK
jgi:tetratricopeptide (TPR) repeat protein